MSFIHISASLQDGELPFEEGKSWLDKWRMTGINTLPKHFNLDHRKYWDGLLICFLFVTVALKFYVFFFLDLPTVIVSSNGFQKLSHVSYERKLPLKFSTLAKSITLLFGHIENLEENKNRYILHIEDSPFDVKKKKKNTNDSCDDFKIGGDCSVFEFKVSITFLKKHTLFFFICLINEKQTLLKHYLICAYI